MIDSKIWNITFDILLYLDNLNFYDIKKIRKDINEKLVFLFDYDLRDQDFIKLIIFYIDEKILIHLQKNYFEWKLLQVSYFDINNGGRVFFEVIDKNKNHEIQKLALILIKMGFKGKFFACDTEILKYTEFLTKNLQLLH